MKELTETKFVLLKGEVEAIKRNLETTIDEIKRHLTNAEERAAYWEGHDDLQYGYFLGKTSAYEEVLSKLGKGGDVE